MAAIIIGAIGLFGAFFFQRKKYQMSYAKMFILYVIFTLSGAIGAKFGSVISLGSRTGMRLYGLILLNIVIVPIVAKLMKIQTGVLGDYIAVPNMIGCATAKFQCLRSNCCYGCVIFTNNLGNEIRFPSKWVEIGMWFAMAGWLLYMEKKQRGNLLRWPVTVIWFGILRFVADLFRGAASERRPFLLGLPAGQFWSLIILVIGMGMLIFAFCKYRGHNPNIKEIICVLLGKEVK